MSGYIALAIAIASEVTATTSLKMSSGFTRLIPSIIVVIGYGASFFFSAISLKTLPLGFTYAVWSGAGTVGVIIIGVMLFNEGLNIPKAIGIVMIIAGIILVNTFGPEVAAS